MSRRGRAWLIACLPVLVAAVACSSGTETPTGPSTDIVVSATPSRSPVPTATITAAIIELTNLERQRVGLPALRAEARLMQAAQLQAEQNATLGRLDHVLPDARYPSPEDRLAAAGYPWQAYGENIAYGHASVAAVVTAWMNSPGHRENIVSPSFTEIGAGHTIDRSGRPYYAQVFGRPR